MTFDRTNALPARLRSLALHLRKAGTERFGDWELKRAHPLANLFPDADRALLERVSASFLVFAGDFAGGLLALEQSADPERANVICFSSEGEIDVLGQGFDDFLALISADTPDPAEDTWAVDDALRHWIVASGVTPHASAYERLSQLGQSTRSFRMRFNRALRQAAASLRPTETLDLLLAPPSIGNVSLGMTKSALDSSYGTPDVPSWGRRDGRYLALYSSCPVVVAFAEASDRVSQITHYAGRQRVTTSQGVELMYMQASEACEWAIAMGWEPQVTRNEVVVPKIGLHLGLEASRGGARIDRWVESIELSAV